MFLKTANIFVIGTAMLGMAQAVQAQPPTDEYDCNGKPDGNYKHPTDCTRFISCSSGVASVRDCADCKVDPVSCPEGRLIYDPKLDICLYADETEVKCDVEDEGQLGDL